MKVYVFVSVWRGVEAETKAFSDQKKVVGHYKNFAEGLGLTYDKDVRDYDWSHSDYTAWWSECELE
ncbi:MAG: hypothetical protein PHU49_11300 [Syntrophorhabdaceae bacterium]|nr:hypothetical protein [Syntrophorhabdaceae bacterium]